VVTGHDEKIAVRVAVLERDFDGFEHVVSKIEATLEAFNKNLQQLVRLDERHIALEEKQQETNKALARAFEAIEKIDKRTSAIEVEIPGFREVRALIVRGVCIILLSVLGLMLIAAGIHPAGIL